MVTRVNLPSGSVGGTAYLRQRGCKADHVVADTYYRSSHGHCQPAGGQSASTERNTDVGAIETLCLAPPPMLREASTPVLLGVDLGCVELPPFASDR